MSWWCQFKDLLRSLSLLSRRCPFAPASAAKGILLLSVLLVGAGSMIHACKYLNKEGREISEQNLVGGGCLSACSLQCWKGSSGNAHCGMRLSPRSWEKRKRQNQSRITPIKQAETACSKQKERHEESTIPPGKIRLLQKITFSIWRVTRLPCTGD